MARIYWKLNTTRPPSPGSTREQMLPYSGQGGPYIRSSLQDSIKDNLSGIFQAFTNMIYAFYTIYRLILQNLTLILLAES